MIALSLPLGGPRSALVHCAARTRSSGPGNLHSSRPPLIKNRHHSLHTLRRTSAGLWDPLPRAPASEARGEEALRARAAVDLPPIDGDITEAMLESGAELDGADVALTFGNDAAALEAAFSGAVLYNMTHFGRIRVSGDDRIRFLQNQTSADFQNLQNGQGCFTVFQTAQARTIDLAFAWIMTKAVILTVSPSQRAKLLTLMDRYIFPADKVEVADITDKTCQLAIIGPASHEVVRKLGIEGLIGAPLGTHRHFSVDGSPATVAVGSGMALPGYTLLLSADVAGRVWLSLAAEGAIPMGEAAWNRLRVLQGRPAPGSELREDYNPLEAGLWGAVSNSKGCYIGQETIARLITYNGVKQQLWGIQLPEPVEPGALLTDKDGQKIGKVTSCVEGLQPGTYAALGYVKRLDAPAQSGTEVLAGGVQGTLVEVPFLTRELSPVPA